MKTIAAILIVLCVACVVNAQWAQWTPMNASRYGLDAIEYNGDIYAVGGMDNLVPVTTMERYSGGTWTYLANLPVAQGYLCAALVGDKIYSFGGYGPLSTIQIYDIPSNTWSTSPAVLPIPLYWATAETVGKHVYVIGGYTVPGGAQDDVYILNTTTNSWTMGTPCPVTLQGCTSVIYNGYIYVFSYNGDYKYNYTTDTWTSIANRTYLTRGASAEVINDAIYVIGGHFGNIYEAEDYTQIYDTASDYWTMGPDMIFARYHLASAYVNDYLYSIGGRDANGGSNNWVERLYVMGGPPMLELSMTPITANIPAGGGMFRYIAYVTNNTGSLLVRDAWTYVRLPGGAFYGPLMTRTVNLPPGLVTAPNLREAIPGYAPPGEYTFHGYVGTFVPWIVDATNTCYFTKLTTGPGNVDEWFGTEWEFTSDANRMTVERPSEYTMVTAYPNPFNASTVVTVNLPEPSELTVTVFNAAGQTIAELASGSYTAGINHFTFDASGLASGLYFIHATVPGHLNKFQKVMLVR